MDKTCGTCRWWSEQRRGEGQCHRYPPFVVRPGDRFWKFPLTRTGSFCGEHQPKEKPHG